MTDAEYIRVMERQWDRAWPAICIVAAAVESYDRATDDAETERRLNWLIEQCRMVARLRDDICPPSGNTEPSR